MRVEPMIVVRPMGGLGNQCFIYAAGRALALRFGVPLKMDLSHYREQTFRSFCLDRMAVAVAEVTPAERRWFAARAPDRLLPRMLRAVGAKRETVWFVPPVFAYDPGFERVRPPVSLLGYFQSERHFAEHAAVIRQDLRLKDRMDAANLALAARVRHPGSVCVHVRRTDYVTDATFRQWAQACTPEYYRSAADLMRARVREPEFFVFSDDPAWCRSSLDFLAPATVVTENGIDKPHLDLALMAACSHHIVANSTLSWWGAWLGEKAGQTVVAPRVWWSNPGLDDSTVVPERWLRV